MPVILTILILTGVYAISITVITIKHPVNSTGIMYSSLASWGINETKHLLLEAINGSPPQDFIHGIGLSEFTSIRVINSSELIMGNSTYCYALIELSLNNALIWLKNFTICGYTILVKIYNTTYYNGSYLVTMRIYRDGTELGSISYKYIVPILSIESPQINAWWINDTVVLMMDAWYYLVINEPEQLVTASNRVYPHGSLSLWLFMVPKDNCLSYCNITNLR